LATSDPRPVEKMTGIKAMIVVNVVIKQGRIRFMPASTMAYRKGAVSPLDGKSGNSVVSAFRGA
jgi:hypothetical protein